MSRILIIDDDKFMADLHRHRFQVEGFAVDFASDGRTGIKHLKDDPPDVVLLDLMLPDVNGLEVLKFIRSNPKLAALPVVVLSTSCAGILDIASDAGASQCLNKTHCTPTLLVKAVRDAMAAAAHSSPSVVAEDSAQILLADDDRVIHGVLGFFLTQAGFGMRSAFTGQEALDMATREKPDLLVLDRMMPGMDGIALLKEWQRRPELAKIPVIMLTARSAAEDRDLALREGAADYLTKPFGPDELVEKLTRFTRKTE